MKEFMHKDFARRLEQACDGNPGVPQLHRGRLGWFVEHLSQHGIKVTGETVRKWFIGETRPKPQAMEALAQMLKQDVAWLATGSSSVIPAAQTKARNAQASGAVNVVAGFIQMAGYHPAFPDATDTIANDKRIDLYAVIQGQQHQIHVAPIEVVEKKKVFRIPVESQGLTIVGVIPDSPVSVEFVNIDWDTVANSPRRAGAFEVPASRKFKRIETFGTSLK